MHLIRMCILLQVHIFHRCIRSSWFIDLYFSSFLILSCSIIESEVLKSPTFVELFLLSILAVFAQYVLGLCCLVHMYLLLLYLLGEFTILSLYNVLPCLSKQFLSYSLFCLILVMWLLFAWNIFFPILLHSTDRSLTLKQVTYDCTAQSWCEKSMQFGK